MVCFAILITLPALLGAGPQQASAPGKPEEKALAPVPGRTFLLPDVHGPADRTGIPGRIDHMTYDPATRRLFVACVANGSLEVIDLDSGSRAGSVRELRGPQGVAVAGGSVYVTTGDDGKLLMSGRFCPSIALRKPNASVAGRPASAAANSTAPRSAGRKRRTWL